MVGSANIRAIVRFVTDRSGATAAEFALILAPLILLTLGTINLCAMMYTASTLHYAAENTARWASIKATANAGVAPLGPAVQTYGASIYKGATASVTFTRSNAGCGNTVVATANYNFTTGLTSSVVPLSASACYPLG
jgi:Flp pilus assembly protein TadG